MFLLLSLFFFNAADAIFETILTHFPLATLTGTKIPLTVTPNNIAPISVGEALNDTGSKGTNKTSLKSKTGKNGSKKVRKSLLQEQQEVLQKNGKNVNETSLGDSGEDSKVPKNVSERDESAQNHSKTPNGGSSISMSGSHPRNRWRCMQPRVCNYCWKTFSNSFNLKQHIVNVHVQSQGVSCSLCEKVVKNKWYLRKHLVTAHGAPLKRIKGNESGGSNLALNTELSTKEANNEQTDPIDAAVAVAAAAAAANIPLASFMAAANNISQQQQSNINNNIGTVASAISSSNLNGNTGGKTFAFSTQSNAGSIIGIPDVSERKRLSKKNDQSTKGILIRTDEDEEEENGQEEEEEELIVDT